MSTPQQQYRNLSEQGSGYFECQLPVIQETDKAICFDNYKGYLASGYKGVWIPKSQMIILNMGNDSGTRYFIKNWLYSKLK